jgi:hypothetical protein
MDKSLCLLKTKSTIHNKIEQFVDDKIIESDLEDYESTASIPRLEKDNKSINVSSFKPKEGMEDERSK